MSNDQPQSIKPETPTSPQEILAHVTTETGKAIVGGILGVGGAVVSTASKAGEAITDAGEAVFSTASKAGEAITDLTTLLGNFLHDLVEQATQRSGEAVTFVSDSPLIRKLGHALKLDWLVDMTNQVDLVKAETEVKQLKAKYPNESPSQIAHRLMVEKAIYAGGVGLASSLVPGEAIALLAVDVATTTALQTEMLYQIAAAYGLDLKDPARKGEILAIFALSFGGSRAIKAGLAFVKTVPFAGAVIGASANATMLYTLGYAACRFYEAKLDDNVVETAPETLKEIKERSDTYLEVAIAQQTVMDQILVHMILASYPEASWEDVLPKLQSLQFEPASLDAIANHIKSPQPLGALLDQLNLDFAILTLSRAYAIAHLDGTISPEEAKVLDAIAEKFELDLESIKTTVNAAS
jgi:uncharacterized protein (DUF697 family)